MYWLSHVGLCGWVQPLPPPPTPLAWLHGASPTRGSLRTPYHTLQGRQANLSSPQTPRDCKLCTRTDHVPEWGGIQARIAKSTTECTVTLPAQAGTAAAMSCWMSPQGCAHQALPASTPKAPLKARSVAVAEWGWGQGCWGPGGRSWDSSKGRQWEAKTQEARGPALSTCTTVPSGLSGKRKLKGKTTENFKAATAKHSAFKCTALSVLVTCPRSQPWPDPSTPNPRTPTPALRHQVALYFPWSWHPVWSILFSHCPKLTLLCFQAVTDSSLTLQTGLNGFSCPLSQDTAFPSLGDLLDIGIVDFIACGFFFPLSVFSVCTSQEDWGWGVVCELVYGLARAHSWRGTWTCTRTISSEFLTSLILSLQEILLKNQDFIQIYFFK